MTNFPNTTDAPIDYVTYDTVDMARPNRSNHGATSLILAGTAAVLAPVLALVPFIGFLLPVLALIGVVVAFKGTRAATGNRTTAVVGLVVSSVVLAVTAGITMWWNFSVVVPALGDYEGLRELLTGVWESAPS